ncbi:MAG: hypothetical protein IPK12_24605 [Gemmatimonadetes bacterium]|nr:hypothetical protein [Gemmatimonadota bacterium]
MGTILAWVQDDRTSVSEVADVVLRVRPHPQGPQDRQLPYYNRWGTSALTATHAIALIGAKTIRDLVVGLMLFEHYQRKSPGLRS